MNRFRRSLALLLVFAMVFTTFAAVTVSAQTFSDVSGHWAEALIDKWSASGVINGYEDGTFRPDENITRAEIAKVISVSKGYTEEAAIAFSDVSEDDWFMPSLKKCVAKNVIGGYEDGTFRPDTYVNREEAATMIVRAYNINATALLSFTDSSDISPWAQNAVTALVGANVINGYEDGSFGPKNSITRAELVKMLDGAASAEILFPQATDSTGGTNSVGTIGNLGGFHGSGSTSGGGGGSSTSRSYNVTFDANGGSFENGRTSQSVSVSQNMVVGSRVSDPTKEGMKFDGWYTSKDAADQLISSKKWALNTDKVTKSMTLYAGWYAEGDVTVAFESCGGSAVAAQTVQSGNLVAEPAAPTRANYTFTGWYTDNKATKKFDFANTTIRKNTTLYAGWSLNADYTGAEITLPDETDPESNLKTGSVVAVPPTAIAGETVNLKVTAPEGFTLEGIKSITYLASVTEGETTTEQTVTLDPAAIKYNEETDTYSFVMPADAIGNVKVIPLFEQKFETPKPSPSVEPTPTPTPEKMPQVYFTSPTFKDLTTVEKGKAYDGITFTRANGFKDSNEVFSDSEYKYTRAMDFKNDASFEVLGSCEIVFDIKSSNSNERAFTVKSSSATLHDVKVNGDSITQHVTYTGGKDTIKISSTENLLLYGIDIIYDSSVSPAPSSAATATPTPTPTPSAAPVDPLVPQESAKAWTAADNYNKLYEHSAKSSKTKFDIEDVNMDNLYMRSSAGPRAINYEDVLLEQNAAAMECFDPNYPGYYSFADGMIFTSQILNFRELTEMEFIPSATKSGKLKLYYKGQAPEAWMVTVIQGNTETEGIVGADGDIIEVNVKAKENVRISSVANGWLVAVAYIPDGTTLEPTKPSAAPSTAPASSYTVKVDEGVTGGTVELVKPAEASAPPSAEPPAGDYIESAAINTETTWLFDTTSMADVLTADSGKNYVISNTKYKELVLYATDASKIEVDDSGKTVGEITGTGRLKLGGTGKDAGADSARMLTFMPGVAGTVTVAAAHASSSGTARTLNVYQGETLLDGGLSLEAGSSADKTFNVKANEIVKIYSATSGINIYGIKFTPTASALIAEIAEGETFVKELTAKPGDTVKVKAVPTKEGDKVTMYSKPSAEFVLGDDGYYAFTMPSSDITVGAVFGDVAPPSAEPPAGDYIESAAINTETTWLFDTTSMADVLTADSGKNYVISNTKYKELVLYATDASKIEVDDSGKTVGEITGTGRLKLGGTGKDAGADSARMLTFMPGVAGTVTVAAAHASSSGTARTLNVYQGETLLDGGLSLEAGSSADKTFNVKANEIVKIYSATSGINIYGIKFTPAQ